MKICLKSTIVTSLLLISATSSSYAADAETKVFPTQSWSISQGYGWQYEHDPYKKVMKFHPGIDILGDPPVYAYQEGTVVYVGEEKGYGNLVKISHQDGLETWYGHLESVKVKVGQTVKAGDPIAQIGTDHAARKSHLHFEVRLHGQSVDPGPYIAGASTLNDLVYYIKEPSKTLLDKVDAKEQARQAAQHAYEQADLAIYPPLPRCGVSVGTEKEMLPIR